LKSSADQGEIFKFSEPGCCTPDQGFEWRANATETLWPSKGKAPRRSFPPWIPKLKNSNSPPIFLSLLGHRHGGFRFVHHAVARWSAGKAAPQKARLYGGVYTPGKQLLLLGEELRLQVLRRDGWRCQSCGALSNLEVHHRELRSHSGDDSEQNLITLCTGCHAIIHRGTD